MRLRHFALLLLAPALAACESSMRIPALGTPWSSSPPPRQAPAPVIEAAPTPNVQTAPLPPPVTSQPLPPPPGTSAMPESSYPGAATPAGASPSGGALTPATPPQEPPKLATRTEPETPPAAPSRTALTGTWAATEASGGVCKVTLSSSPKLDLYNAASAGCQSKELQRITAWELRGDEIYLYESGGAVAARLRSGGARSYAGSLAKTGAPVSLAK